MESIRCCECNRLLAYADAYVIEIKCPKCKTVNYQKATSLSPERLRASTRQDATHARDHKTPSR